MVKKGTCNQFWPIHTTCTW